MRIVDVRPAYFLFLVVLVIQVYSRLEFVIPTMTDFFFLWLNLLDGTGALLIKIQQYIVSRLPKFFCF